MASLKQLTVQMKSLHWLLIHINQSVISKLRGFLKMTMIEMPLENRFHSRIIFIFFNLNDRSPKILYSIHNNNTTDVTYRQKNPAKKYIRLSTQTSPVQFYYYYYYSYLHK